MQCNLIYKFIKDLILLQGEAYSKNLQTNSEHKIIKLDK